MANKIITNEIPLMNRKKNNKIEKERKKVADSLHDYDKIESWCGADFSTPPWSREQINEFQKKIDSAFGGEGLVLAWSGEKQYWDEFFTDWFANGLPKGTLEKKPILLFAQVDVNDHDYVYISAPRWMILERLHPNEYAPSWTDSAWVEDNAVLGGKKRIRAEHPPKAFYKVLRTIAEHETPYQTNDIPPCCLRWRKELMRICYGKYKPPSDEDLAYIRQIRENMDRAGVVQRNDAPRSEKVLAHAAASTSHYIKSAAMARTREVSDMIASDPYPYLVDVIKNKGITLTDREIQECVEIGLERAKEEREKEVTI